MNPSTIRFTGLGDVQAHYAPLDEVGSLPASAGWYCWCFLPDLNETGKSTPYCSTHVDAQVRGYFGRTLSGKLRAGVAVRSTISADWYDDFAACMLLFASPLYIGLSKDLRRRLLQHRKKLRDFLADAPTQRLGEQEAFDSAADARAAEIAPDTDHESQHFGERIGARLLADRAKSSSLFVRAFTCSNPASLKQTESLLNLMLSPQYGRR